MTGDEENDAIGSPPSPCVRNCCLDPEDVCMGCFRSLAEICAWHEASDTEKVATLIRCRERYRKHCEKYKRSW